MGHRHLIREYYSKVDSGDLDWVLALFAEESEYLRADACYPDKRAITEFYRVDRKIVGVHTLNRLYESGDTVIVDGVFDGAGADGAEKHVSFADFWQFDAHHLVCSRKTYLAVGSNIVKD